LVDVVVVDFDVVVAFDVVVVVDLTSSSVSTSS